MIDTTDKLMTVCSRRRAFTIVELMIALVITALLATGVTTMLFAVSQGTSSNTDQRRVNAKRLILAERVGNVIRAAAQVLDVSTSSLTVWYGDRNEDGKVNLSEMANLKWSSADQTIVYSTGATGLAEDDDTGYDISSDFASVAASLDGTANFPSQTWATNVSASAFTANTSRIVTIDMTVSDADNAATADINATFSLRGTVP